MRALSARRAAASVCRIEGRGRRPGRARIEPAADFPDRDLVTCSAAQGLLPRGARAAARLRRASRGSGLGTRQPVRLPRRADPARPLRLDERPSARARGTRRRRWRSLARALRGQREGRAWSRADHGPGRGTPSRTPLASHRSSAARRPARARRRERLLPSAASPAAPSRRAARARARAPARPAALGAAPSDRRDEITWWCRPGAQPVCHRRLGGSSFTDEARRTSGARTGAARCAARGASSRSSCAPTGGSPARPRCRGPVPGSSASAAPSSLRPRPRDLELALRTTRHKGGSWNRARAARYLGWDPDTLDARLEGRAFEEPFREG
jgi:hypothetical protein